MSNRSRDAQLIVIREMLTEMHLWYLANSGGKDPDHLCEDDRGYKGKTLRWYEPMLPGLDNPVLIEEAIGDHWSLRYEPSRPSVSVYK